MSTLTASPAAATATPQASPLVMRILGACALAHLINDLIQAVLPSIYPMLKAKYDLTFTQIGLITLTFQMTASLLQPWAMRSRFAGETGRCSRNARAAFIEA